MPTPSSSEGGSGLPSQWTTDANGNLIITSASTVADHDSVLTLKNAGGDTMLEVDSRGDLTIHTLGRGLDLRASDGSGIGTDPGLVQLNSGGNAQVFLVKGTGGHADFFMLSLLNTAPTDADVGAGAVCLWLDDTPAATKLMVKGADSGGTIRTAAIALA